MQFKTTKDVANSRFIALIVGPSGIGKTTLARTLNEKETLIISAESGLLSLAGTDIAVYELEGQSTPVSSRLKEIYLYLLEGNHSFKNIFVDSLTEIAESILSELKNDPEYADPKKTFKMYGEYNDKMTQWVKIFRDLKGVNVIFTCLNSTKKDGMEEYETFNLPGQSLKDNIKAWFDLVLSYQVFYHEGETYRKLVTDIEKAPLSKDRSGRLDAYEDADLGKIMKKVLA